MTTFEDRLRSALHDELDTIELSELRRTTLPPAAPPSHRGTVIAVAAAVVAITVTASIVAITRRSPDTAAPVAPTSPVSITASTGLGQASTATQATNATQTTQTTVSAGTAVSATTGTATSAAGLITMPDLIGLTADQALAALRQAGWSGTGNGLTQTQGADPNQALWGMIRSQQPAAGSKIGANSAVAVSVATEPHVAVPDLTGKTVDQALNVLRTVGWHGQLLSTVHRELTPPTGQANLIFNQSPEPSGLILVTGLIKVDIYPNASTPTSTAADPTTAAHTAPTTAVQATATPTTGTGGPGLITMPDLTKLTPGQALAALRQAGWSGSAKQLTQGKREDPDQAQWGLIRSQQPAAGSKISENSAIAVTVAIEPHLAMPDVTGMTVNQAYDALTAAGWHGQLSVTVHRELTTPEGHANQIFNQSPGWGHVILITDPIKVDVYPNASATPPTG